MSKFIVIMFLVTALTVTLVKSQNLGTIKNSEKPEKPGYCFDDELNEYYPEGTVKQRTGLCQMVNCFKNTNGPGLTLRKEGCAIPSVFCKSGKFEQIPEDPSKPFPSCCEQINCQ